MERKKGFRLNASATQKILAFGTLIVLFIAFSIASPNFFKYDNIISILVATCANGILALGVTFVIVTGGIDLSIGTVMTFSSVIAGVAATMLGLPTWAAVSAASAAGSLCGVVNGFAVSRMKIPAFIATLGMMMITKGLSLVISGAKPIYFEGAGYGKIAMGNIIPNVPNAILIFIAAAIVAAVILSKTRLGRYNFAIGSNMEATRLSGVNVAKWTTIIYTLCGAFAGLAGIIMSSRLNSAQPALGQGYELEAIAAVVIGGTSLSGGEGSILGTVIGAFIMTVLINGLRILQIKQEWQTVIVGIVVIGAVYADVMRRRKKSRV